MEKVEVTFELNLEQWHAWWRDRRQVSPPNGLTYGVERGCLSHLHLLKHSREQLPEADRGEAVRGYDRVGTFTHWGPVGGFSANV